MCALTVSTPRYGLAEAGFVWLSVPAISLTQWHPFEYVACAGDAGSPGALLMHIKSYNRCVGVTQHVWSLGGWVSGCGCARVAHHVWRVAAKYQL